MAAGLPRDQHKTWKLTDEDWRNREKWGAYEEAVEDMLLKTSTLHAPWTVIEGEDKRWARIKVLRTVVELIAAARAAAEPPAAEEAGKRNGKKKGGKKKGGKKKGKKGKT